VTTGFNLAPAVGLFWRSLIGLKVYGWSSALPETHSDYLSVAQGLDLTVNHHRLEIKGKSI